MATKKRVESHPVTKKELRENNPSIADLVTNRLARWKNLSLSITAIVAVGIAVYQGYFFLGGRAIITDYSLERAIKTQNEVIDNKINNVKTDVNKNVTSAKGEITNSLTKLNDTLNTVARSQTAATMDQVDLQMRLAFTQKQSLQSQLTAVNQALLKNKNDQLALQRKMQLEDFIKANDQYMMDAQNKMTKLRSGQ